MVKEISKGLKWIFLINFIYSLVFGVLLFFMVEIYLGWFGIPFQSPFFLSFGGLFGGILLGYASASFMAWKQTEWEKVKIVVIMNIIWNMLGAFIFLGEFYAGALVFFGVVPSYAVAVQPLYIPLIYLIPSLGFLAAFIYFYSQHEKKKKLDRG
ncbi:MAG: hypothetical protein ACFFDN_47650 [Candidatus Hodarchaeota archaeon]